MTNRDKFLKPGVNALELWEKFSGYYYKNKNNESDVAKAFELFFCEQATPTLTEDERVILRNINKNFTHIYRLNNRLQVADGEENCNNTILDITAFGHLFQFIKERRRIRDSRTFERRIEMENIFALIVAFIAVAVVLIICSLIFILLANGLGEILSWFLN